MLSGNRSDRPGLHQLLEIARTGDKLMIWRLNRLGRSLQDLITLVNVLESKGLHLRSLNEQIDTSSSTGKLEFYLFGAMAKFECSLIGEHNVAGLEAARKPGRKGGRLDKLDLKQCKEIRILMKNPEMSVVEAANRYGVPRSTVYMYAKKPQ